MNIAERTRLEKYIRSLKEDEIRKLLLSFFASRNVRAEILHASGEHGMDIVAYIEPKDDILGRGYNILVQAKIEKLTLDEWRKKVLYPLLELPYYSIRNANYIDALSRRILLVVSNEVTPEASHSIAEFNAKHEVTIDVWALNDMISEFERANFASQLLLLVPETLGASMHRAIELPTVGKRIAKQAPERGSAHSRRPSRVRGGQRANRS